LSAPETSRSGADLVAACLAAEGVDVVFGLPGTTVMDLIDSIARRDDIRFISVRHEQVAGFMADGYSRVGGGLGVCLASRGPGAANLSIAVQNAHDESVAMLALIGQVPTGLVERRAFEEMDVLAAFRPISKWAVEITAADRIPELLQRAVRTATTGRPGPVVVSLPLDTLQHRTEAAPQVSVRTWPPAPHPDAITRAATAIAGSTKPVIICGGGAAGVPHSDLVSLASAAEAPVVTTWLRKNVFPNRDPHFAGSLGYGAYDVTDALVRDADVVVALGCRFSEFTTKRWTIVPTNVPLIQVDIDPAELGRVYPPTIGLVSDAGLAVRALSGALAVVPHTTAQASRRSRLEQTRAHYARLSAELPVSRARPGEVGSTALVRAIREVSRRDDVVLVQDVHTFGPWVQRYVEFERPNSYYGAAGGAMAWGFPAAMGMALARPDRRVVSLSGDGSFWMVAQDFETCVREGVRVVNVIVNNFAYGNTRDRQRYAHEERFSGVFLGNPDFARFAQILGGHGERVTKDEDVLPAIARAIDADAPAIVDIVQGRLEGLPPGLVPLSAH
jgi:acetolactate synthase I/II/III large subunit